MDLFAEALFRCYVSGSAKMRVERDDGSFTTEDLSWYLTSYSAFPKYEKQALKFVSGRVLDVGCGAGRHALYLQRKGLQVTGIESSPHVAAIAAERGVRDVRIASACEKPLGAFERGAFDTVLMFGNNLGICGTETKFRGMLQELHRITSPSGRILASTRRLDETQKKQRAYIERNLRLGRSAGQVRLRLHYDGKRGAWFNLLLFSPGDLSRIVAEEGWDMTHLFSEDAVEDGYSVVLEKI